jgi:acetylornithine/succinyldiaminopimelate/putrescine aminotransferase
MGGRITRVLGTGLIASTELDPIRYKNFGSNSTEEYMRKHGINVIHGGSNALRFTPPFDITSEGVDLIVECTRDAVLNGPVKMADTASQAA